MSKKSIIILLIVIAVVIFSLVIFINDSNTNIAIITNTNSQNIHADSITGININTIITAPNNFITYNNAVWNFQIDHPSTWLVTENNNEDGYEILQLVLKDSDVENSAHGGQDPNSAKLSLSFYLKNAMDFNTRITSLIPSENIISLDEEIDVSGLRAKKINDEGDLGKTMRLFIDYDNQYLVLINGYYGDSEEMNILIEQINEIQNSFKKLL